MAAESGAGQTIVTDVFWDDLLLDIRKGVVIPVIGRELLTVERDGSLVNLEDELAEDFARQYLPDGAGAPSDQRRTGRSSLAMAAARYRSTCTYRDNPDDVYPAIRQLLKSAYESPIPPPLETLAKITDFKMFVTTTSDRWLQKALARHDRQTVLRAFALNGACPEDRDLPFACNDFDPRDWPATFVYHLLGVEGPRDFAVTEEDMLEFMHQLQEPHRAPTVLLDMLNKSKLLLIGCGLPDWLTRFLVRIAKRKRLTAPGEEYLVVGGTAGNDKGLKYFLDLFTHPLTIWEDGGSIDFIDELYARWAASEGARAAASPPLDLDAFLHYGSASASPAATNGGPSDPAGAATTSTALQPSARGHPSSSRRRKRGRGIFLSYASEDRPEVEKLNAALEAEGLEVWFDQDELESGQKYDDEIREIIGQCDAFVPVLSQHVLPDRNPDRYFRSEWSWAVDRAELMRRRNSGVAPEIQSAPLIHPISVDGTSYGEVPFWQDYHWLEIGVFVQRLVEIVERREIESKAALYQSPAPPA
jgi:hypothetical protein